jgi:arginine-tRNA-protein transferase
MQLNRIAWYGELVDNEHCGYCSVGSIPNSVKHSFTSTYMSVENYDKLMNCGWRRCGDYYYKPVMHKVSNK